MTKLSEGFTPIEEQRLNSEKDLRAERFMQILERHHIRSHGAQSVIGRKIGVSSATVAAWMKGSLPREPATLIKFCDEYDVDIYWWVHGQIRPRMSLDIERLVKAGLKVESFAKAKSLKITDEQKMLLVGDVYQSPAEADAKLASTARFFQTQD